MPSRVNLQNGHDANGSVQAAATEGKKIRVGVIGAGSAGLVSLRHITARPHMFEGVAFEKAARVGGTWLYSEETGKDKHGHPIHSSMYKNLRTNIPKEVMAFPDFPFDKELPSFITHTEVEAYLEAYAKHYDLYKHIKFETFVDRVHPVTGKDGKVTWEVTVTDLKTKEQTMHEFDGIIVCNGHYSVPLMPELPGLEEFEGELEHSHNYREPEPYTGKTVVCLGAAASGMDIGIEISRVADKVYLSHNRPRIVSAFPDNLEQVPGIASVGAGNSVTFKDGRTVKADVILFCTGYRFDFPFLSEACAMDIQDERVPLYKHILHLDYPSLSFIGICKIVCPFPMFHCQVLFILASLSGEMTLPDRAGMEADMQRDFQKRMAEGLPPRHAHLMGPRQWAYNDELAAMAGIQPIPGNVQKLFDYVHATRVKDLLNYKKINYEMVGSETFKILE